MTSQSPTASQFFSGFFPQVLPGLGLSATIAALAYLIAPYLARMIPIPAIVIALVIGIALNPLTTRYSLQKGMTFCVRNVLRWAVALLGLRVGIADIGALGFRTSALIVLAMTGTVVSGFLIARCTGRTRGFGALLGVGTAVCGASATLACSTVVPEYPGKQADTAFVVVAINTLATIAMLLYPPLCIMLGFNAHTAGVMLGGTIHDVAQVAGAGYALSDVAGNAAVVVKLFRVFLLLPTLLCVAWYLSRQDGQKAKLRVPVPVFAIIFLLLCVVNSAIQFVHPMLPIYVPIKNVLVAASSWGLLIAIAALGLGTSISAILALGWRHIASALATSAVIFAIVTGGLMLMSA